MRRILFIALWLAPALVLAKSWKGITPGVSSGAEVVHRFGEPTRRVKQGEKQVLAYLADEAIGGAREAEFVITASGKVQQIAVFPADLLPRATAEESFGPDCAQHPEAHCFTRKLTDDFKTYDWYESLGLVIFFEKDGKTVQSFLYVPGKPRSASAPARTADARPAEKPTPQPASER